MRSAREIAISLINRYNQITNSNFGSDELKLQKLMYYIQRQSLALTGKPMFEEDFIGWIHGPVLPSLRHFDSFTISSHEVLTDTEEYIIDSVINEYGRFSAWALRDLTHEESSWLKNREGLSETEHGSVKISLDDIYEDAKKVRIYDHQYDMYIDEFEDWDDSWETVT